MSLNLDSSWNSAGRQECIAEFEWSLGLGWYKNIILDNADWAGTGVL